jgi:hypothetical protein
MIRRVADATEGSAGVEPGVDATTILNNIVQLDEMLDEGSRKELGEVQYLELSKHLRIKKAAS